MAHVYTGEEIEKQGQAIYDERLRPMVDTVGNLGKVIVIDITTGDYEIAEEGLVAGRRLQKRHPDAAMLCLRIGYNAVYSFGGVLTRVKQ